VTAARIPPPKKVLVVSLDQLGDLVFASSLVAPVLDRYPGVTVDVLCREPYRGVAALIPGVSKVFAIDPFWAVTHRGVGRRSRGPLRGALSVVRALRAERYDVGVIANAPWRTAAMVATMGIAARIGQARRRNGAFLTHVVDGADATQPVLSQLQRVLQPLGIDTALSTRLDWRRISMRSPEIRPPSGRPAFLALHPFASDAARCVPLPVWRDVAEALGARGWRVLWIGAPHELEMVRASSAAETWHYSDRLAGATLDDLVACVAAAQVFIGHDSGPLHVANALTIPAVGVFAPGEPQRTFPQGPGAWRLVVAAQPSAITSTDIVAAFDTLTSSLEYLK
jgi:ADP-heptose:LPS heptosyltransferase